MPISTGTEHFYTDVVVVDVNKTLFTGKLTDLVGSTLLQGCGRVDLVEIAVSFVCSAENQVVKVGIRPAGHSMSIGMAGMLSNGINFRSNSKNYGENVTKVLVPPDTVTRQIQPNPADLPMLEVLIEKDAKVSMIVTLKVKVHGMRMTYVSLN